MTYTVSQTPKSLNHYIYPNANNAVNLTPSAGDNYACVDEPWNNPNDDTDYVYTTNTANVTDVYDCPNPSLSGTINYVRLIGRAKSHEYAQHSTGNYKQSCYDGTTAYSDNFAPLTTAYSKYYHTWATKPSGGAWTWAAINALRIGLQCSSPIISSNDINWTSRPSAVGDVTQLTSSASGDNYLFVDDVAPDDNATTVFAYPIGMTWYYDLYNITDHTTQVGTINKVTLFYRWKRIGSGYGRYKLKTHATEYTGTAALLPYLTWTTQSTEFTTNPNTSNAWTWDEVDALQIGVDLKSETDGAYCTQVYIVVNYTEDTSPEIRTTQLYAVVNYTPTATTVTLPDPKKVDKAHSRKLMRKTLPSGNYVVYDAGRGGKTLTLIGTETSGAYSDMDDLKTICHYGAKVTVAGLDDTNLNTDYWVSDIQFSAGPGYPANMYDYTLTLEEL